MEAACSTGASWTDIIMAIFTIAIFVVSYMMWKTNQNLDFWTGAMARNAQTMTRLAITKEIEEGKSIQMFWWDKSVDQNMPFEGEHLKPAAVKTVWFSIPPGHRQKKPSKWRKLFSLDM